MTEEYKQLVKTNPVAAARALISKYSGQRPSEEIVDLLFHLSTVTEVADALYQQSSSQEEPTLADYERAWQGSLDTGNLNPVIHTRKPSEVKPSYRKDMLL